MYLHEDLELFRDVINATSEDLGDKDFAVIEKDYYVSFFLTQEFQEQLYKILLKAQNCFA